MKGSKVLRIVFLHCQASSINVNRSTLCDPSLCWTLWVNLNTGAGSGDGWSDGLVGFNGFWVNVHLPPLLFFTCDRKEVPCNQNIHHQRAWWINSPFVSKGFPLKRRTWLWHVSMSWYWGSPETRNTTFQLMGDREVLGDLKVFLTIENRFLDTCWCFRTGLLLELDIGFIQDAFWMLRHSR